MLRKKLEGSALSLLILVVSPVLVFAQEIVNKAEVDQIFALNRAGWEARVKQMAVPPGWEGRTSPHDTGTALAAFDRQTGFWLSVQPLFDDTMSSPGMLVIGSYYPKGVVRDKSEAARLDMERKVGSDLGNEYEVRVQFAELAGRDSVEISITKRSTKQPRTATDAGSDPTANETEFLEGEVSIEAFDMEVTRFALRQNGAVVDVRNDIHIRLLDNPYAPPPFFKIIAPMTAVAVVRGSIPKEYIEVHPLSYYLALRKQYHGE